MENKKYRLDKNDTIKVNGKILIRIIALTSFFSVNAGDKGGYIEKQDNLSTVGKAWVHGNARVSGNAEVHGDAWVSGNAEVHGNARVSGNAWVHGNAEVSGNARVSGKAWVHGDARVYGKARVSGNSRVSGNAEVHGKARVHGDAEVLWITKVGSVRGTLTVFKTKNGYKLSRGCFLGTIEEFKIAVNKKPDNDTSKEEYLKLIPFIEYRFNKYLKA